MPDIEVVCREPNCRAKFVVTEAEQRWFEEKQMVPPKRCKTCRQARKAQNAPQRSAPIREPEPMPEMSGDGYSRRDGGRRMKGRDRDRRRNDFSENW